MSIVTLPHDVHVLALLTAKMGDQTHSNLQNSEMPHALLQLHHIASVIYSVHELLIVCKTHIAFLNEMLLVHTCIHGAIMVQTT